MTDEQLLRGRLEAAGVAVERVEPVDGGVVASGEDEPPRRELRLGFDTGARLLETVVLMLKNGHELVIHAMPARKRYLDLLP